VAAPTRSGASNLDAIIDERTLTIGWVSPAMLGILIAAFGWAGRVFEWLGTLATWLFSGEWRGGGLLGEPRFHRRTDRTSALNGTAPTKTWVGATARQTLGVRPDT